MTIVLVLNPKQYPTTTATPEGPEIWIDILEGWRKRKHVRPEPEPEPEEIAAVEPIVATPILDNSTITAELADQIREFRAVSARLEEIEASIARHLAEQAAIEAEREAMARAYAEYQRQLAIEREIARQRAEIARKILEMQEEEEVLMYLMTH